VPTSFPMAIPHAPTAFVNQAALDNAFSIPINDLYTLVKPLIAGRIQYTQTTGGQALGNGVFTAITAFNGTADVDTFGGSTFNATTGIWTCPSAGQFEISGQVTATGATAVRLIAGIQKGGTTIYSSYESGAPTTQASALLVPKEFTLALGDTITLVGNPNAAAVVTAVQNGNGSFLRIKQVG
jgi:hypothetical protein